MSWVRKLQRPDATAGSGVAGRDGEWMQTFPAIHDHLSLLRAEDGSPRRASTLTLFADSGSWKVWLNDRDAGASLCATGGTIAEALTALEVMLEGENTPWRFSDAKPAPSPRKGRSGS